MRVRFLPRRASASENHEHHRIIKAQRSRGVCVFGISGSAPITPRLHGSLADLITRSWGYQFPVSGLLGQVGSPK